MGGGVNPLNSTGDSCLRDFGASAKVHAETEMKRSIEIPGGGTKAPPGGGGTAASNSDV